VNCQKAFATVIACISLFSSLHALLKCDRACFDMFHEGLVHHNATGNVVDPDSSEVAFALDFDWGVGKGLACLHAGTILKIVDVACNAMAATPAITRDTKERADYEKIPRDDDAKEEDGNAVGEEREDGGQDQTTHFPAMLHE
jgi:hypothetical protein